MRQNHAHGAAAPGAVTPERDNAGWQAGVIGEQGQGDGPNCAAAAIAKAALLGIAVQPLADGWLLRHAGGASIGVVHGVGALAAAVGGFELAVADARELVQRLRRRAQ